jgi:hypothetical protein
MPRVGDRFLGAPSAAGRDLRSATVDVLAALEAMRVKGDGSPVRPGDRRQRHRISGRRSSRDLRLNARLSHVFMLP